MTKNYRDKEFLYFMLNNDCFIFEIALFPTFSGVAQISAMLLLPAWKVINENDLISLICNRQDIDKIL